MRAEDDKQVVRVRGSYTYLKIQFTRIEGGVFIKT